jgi:hypothetical protein
MSIILFKAIKRSPYGRSLCSVRQFQSVHPELVSGSLSWFSLGFPSVPQTLHSTKKIAVPLKEKAGQLFFLRRSVPHLHTVTSCVRRGYYSHNTASFRSATLLCSQQYYVCRPLFFQRLLLRTAIGVGSVRWKTSLCPKSRFPSKKSRECFIFSPPFHAPIRYVSLPLSNTNTLVFSPQLLSSWAKSKDAQLSRLGWLFDCRNPATALLIRNKKFLLV